MSRIISEDAWFSGDGGWLVQRQQE